jgi:hypothetical protein
MLTLNNRVYAFPGTAYLCADEPAPVYMFDGSNWVPRSSTISIPQKHHSALAIDTDRALICGGWAQTTRPGVRCQIVPDCFIYSASSDEWTPAATMAVERWKHLMVMFEGKLIIIV